MAPKKSEKWPVSIYKLYTQDQEMRQVTPDSDLKISLELLDFN